MTFYSEHANLEPTKVKLVELDLIVMGKKGNEGNDRYVTLSHCWGKPRSVQSQLKLTSRNENRFKRDGIELRELSKTFRDAMLFACRLEKVGYIWIDTLCIKQRSVDPGVDESESEKDWREQSRVMDQIYRNSYLNISATAAVDSDKGLFFPRRPEYLWEDEINLNLTGLSGRVREKEVVRHESTKPPGKANIQTNTTRSATWSNSPSQVKSNLRSRTDIHSGRSRKSRGVDADIISDTSRKTRQIGDDYLRRCTIIDLSFWDDLVDQAPVNQRGWVLQERVMAPRVLHFCSNQIAWECSEFQDAEGHPEGVPTLKRKLGDIVDEGMLKSLKLEDGERLRANRLKGFPDPDKHLENIYIHELWKRMAEVYSRTKLTVSRDKLIALSGIARLFSNMFSKQTKYPKDAKHIKCGYVAGMWSEYLESQLLWRADEVYEDGAFESHARRDPTRAPSFSWTALDTPHGIVYGEATNYGKDEKDRHDELLFEVTDYNISLLDPENEFGLIDKGMGSIWLQVRHLRRIQLRKLQPPHRVPYSWRLLDEGPGESSQQPFHGDHFNLYLDAPETDLDIFHETAELYCMPAAYGDRTVKKSSRYLVCLLLKFSQYRGEHREFKRIGLTKLSNYAEQRGQKALCEKVINERICIC